LVCAAAVRVLVLSAARSIDGTLAVISAPTFGNSDSRSRGFRSSVRSDRVDNGQNGVDHSIRVVELDVVPGIRQ